MQGTSFAWDDVRLFLALCRSRSLGEAGRRIGVDGSTMSRRLASLEEALDAPLFERGRGGIVATEVAQRLMPVAEEMEYVMARFRGEAEAFEREVEGRVRIAAPGDAAEVLIAPLLPELRRRYPKLGIDIDPGEQVVDLGRRAADIALRTARPDKGDLLVTRLMTVRWRVATSPELVEALGPLKRWSDAPWIACGERTMGATPGRWFGAHVGDAEPVLRSDSLTLQIASARLGLGVALVPTLSIAHYGLREVRRARRLRPEWPEDDLFLVTPRTLRHVPRVRAVWDLLVEEAARRGA